MKKISQDGHLPAHRRHLHPDLLLHRQPRRLGYVEDVRCTAFRWKGRGKTHDAPELVGLPVAHSVYVWQRSWGEQVLTAVEKASDKVTGFVVLAGEISWTGQDMKFVSVAVDYGMLAGIKKEHLSDIFNPYS